jgi:hypothetical protein
VAERVAALKVVAVMVVDFTSPLKVADTVVAVIVVAFTLVPEKVVADILVAVKGSGKVAVTL